ncbi:hypothetical protein P261_02358 [Lachnospiraceae bacterium TWA4]|nr:hypothetical protein P261_02358 [Lachnospiraceae bacterium TWA4]
MIIRDLFQTCDEVKVIARAILEDRCKPETIDNWITKYYAQLIKSRSSKVQKSDMMFYLSVVSENHRQYRISNS